MKKIASWQCSRQIRTVHFGEPVHAGMDAAATFSEPSHGCFARPPGLSVDVPSLDPNNFPANLLLGRLFVIQQRAADALPYLRKAVKRRPDSIDAHRFLADVYAELGQQENSSRELTEAERLRSQGGSRLGTSTDNPGGLAKQP